MPTSTETDEFFRCPFPAENSSAQIRIGRRTLQVRVQEASIDGFTVLVESLDASKLTLGQPWILLHDDSKLEVHAQWFFHADDGNVQVGLRRLRDLTRPPFIGGWVPSLGGGGRGEEASGGSLLFVSAILIALVSLSLPGVGDALGTSGKIQQGIGAIASGVRDYLP